MLRRPNVCLGGLSNGYSGSAKEAGQHRFARREAINPCQPFGPRPGISARERRKREQAVGDVRNLEAIRATNAAALMPGCLLWSIVLSIALTILLNLLIRLF